jgi:hypothetical protein
MVQQSHAFDMEKRVVNRVYGFLGDDANLFAGMGQNDILLLLRGKDLGALLPKISSLRRDLPLSTIIDNEDKTNAKDSPVLLGSTTFPLVAHPLLSDATDYSVFEGKVRPLVRVACQPGCEQLIYDNRPSPCVIPYEIYGFHDIMLAWENPVDLSTFIKEFTEFRTKLSGVEGIKSTETTFLKLTEEIEGGLAPGHSSPRPRIASTSMPDIDVIREKASKLDPMERAQLLEFVCHLNNSYEQQEYRSYIQDVLGIRYSIIDQLNQLEDAHDPAARFIIRTTLSEIIDLGNNGLYQRYSEFEHHMGASRQLPFPFLRGINGYIMAASTIPYFIFRGVFQDTPIEESWPGYVLFGLSYSYQLLRGRILSLPSNTLLRPIEDWWGLTHEIAHAIYLTSDFYNTDLPMEIRQQLEGLPIGPTNYAFYSKDIDEIYANWFDFRYIFQRDTKRYFQTIWFSWLRWERTWRYKEDYLLRSLAIYVTTDLPGFFDAQNKGFDNTEEFVKIKFKDMKEVVSQQVPEFKLFTKDVTKLLIKRITRQLVELEPYLNFLENKYFEEELFHSLNPSYDRTTLDNHVKSLEEGFIVTEHIPNPIKLLHTLHDIYAGSGRQVPLRTTAATVLTLWRKYLGDRGE